MPFDGPTACLSTRAVFVSDLHLGYRHARANAFLAFLRRIETERLYLVGDIVDGLRLRRSWRWGEGYHAIFDRMIDMARGGTRIFYTPGNHDAFVHTLPWWPEAIEIADETVHLGCDGRRLLVTHGDRFCRFERDRNPLLTRGLELGYDLLLAAQPLRAASDGGAPMPIGSRIRGRLQRSSGYIEEYERNATAHAVRRGFDGIVCGHAHAPDLKRIGGAIYANSGDWVEHSTALIENEVGELQVLDFDRPRSVPLLRTDVRTVGGVPVAEA